MKWEENPSDLALKRETFSEKGGKAPSKKADFDEPAQLKNACPMPSNNPICDNVHLYICLSII